MARAKRICGKTGCPEPAAGRWCVTHNREADKARGTSTERGYGTQHQAARASLKPYVEAGHTTCCRCQQPIQPGEAWHLDHNDEDRSTYDGPAHARCNTSAGGKRAHLYD